MAIKYSRNYNHDGRKVVADQVSLFHGLETNKRKKIICTKIIFSNKNFKTFSTNHFNSHIIMMMDFLFFKYS